MDKIASYAPIPRCIPYSRKFLEINKYFQKFPKSHSLSEILFPKNQHQSSLPVIVTLILAHIDMIPKFNFQNKVFIVISENIYLRKFPTIQ